MSPCLVVVIEIVALSTYSYNTNMADNRLFHQDRKGIELFYKAVIEGVLIMLMKTAMGVSGWMKEFSLMPSMEDTY
jgi:hypothetical protein